MREASEDVTVATLNDRQCGALVVTFLMKAGSLEAISASSEKELQLIICAAGQS